MVPLPSCPNELSPQHHNVPDVRRAQVWRTPAATWLQSVADPTCAGDPLSMVEPSPSWPDEFWPQHHNVNPNKNPPLMPHRCESPSTTVVQSVAEPTWRGRSPLFCPQHHSEPATGPFVAQLCRLPAVTTRHDAVGKLSMGVGSVTVTVNGGVAAE